MHRDGPRPLASAASLVRDDRTDNCAFGAMMSLALRRKFGKLRFQMIANIYRAGSRTLWILLVVSSMQWIDFYTLFDSHSNRVAWTERHKLLWRYFRI